MIGNFARLMRTPPRAIPLEEVASDAPPERFTQKISDEGGDVYVAPMLEALRAALARAVKRGQASDEASMAAPQEETGDLTTEGRP